MLVDHLQRETADKHGLFELLNPAVNARRAGTRSSAGYESTSPRQSSFLPQRDKARGQRERCGRYESALSQDQRVAGMLL